MSIANRVKLGAIFRQVLFTAGLFTFSSGVAALLVPSSKIPLGVIVFVGFMQMFAGMTTICPLGIFYSYMPWNKGVDPCALTAQADRALQR